VNRKNATLGLAVAMALAVMLSAPAAARDSLASTITFCSKVGKSSGKLYGVADSFVLEKGQRVRGIVDIKGARPGRELVFHLLWLTPEGKDAFMKREAVVPEETTARLETSLALDPDRRDPGTYLLKVYLFRKLLVAEPVELLPSGEE
jgi:hypothetical protein